MEVSNNFIRIMIIINSVSEGVGIKFWLSMLAYLFPKVCVGWPVQKARFLIFDESLCLYNGLNNLLYYMDNHNEAINMD